MMQKNPKSQPVRDPNWRARRKLGHRVIKLVTRYTRKVKHRSQAVA